MSKKRNYSAVREVPKCVSRSEKLVQQVLDDLLQSAEDNFSVQISAELAQSMPLTVFVDSLNIARINMCRLPGHDLEITSHFILKFTPVSNVIAKIVTNFLSDDYVKQEPETCGDCMFPLHKKSQGMSVNCKSFSQCILCKLDILSLEASPVQCCTCNGYIVHEECVADIQTTKCLKCVPRENRVQCVGCNFITYRKVKPATKCTSCTGYVCVSCREETKCSSCFELTCTQCQICCIECDRRYCSNCWDIESFDCHRCSDRLLCRNCSSSSTVCTICYKNSRACVLCSDFSTCNFCGHRTCENCDCNCEIDDFYQ